MRRGIRLQSRPLRIVRRQSRITDRYAASRGTINGGFTSFHNRGRSRRVMNNRSSQALVPFTPQTKEAFLQYLLENPSSRRISRHETENLLEWLTNPSKRPTSQTEFSRRNYVRKTFTWDKDFQNLLAKPKSGEGCHRVVVFEDRIADTVERVHESNGHAGWDSTWKSISISYYGILRSDVIYLLKQCQVCAHDPSKRPKRTKANVTDPSSAHEALSTSEREVIERDDINWGSWTCEDPAAGQSK